VIARGLGIVFKRKSFNWLSRPRKKEVEMGKTMKPKPKPDK